MRSSATAALLSSTAVWNSVPSVQHTHCSLYCSVTPIGYYFIRNNAEIKQPFCNSAVKPHANYHFCTHSGRGDVTINGSTRPIAKFCHLCENEGSI
jgi:hypothetical protein